MKKTLIYTASLFAALSSSSVLAQIEGTGTLNACLEDGSPTKATNVYFGNGVGNTYRYAQRSTAYLKIFAEEDVLPKLGSDAGTFNFLTAYNPTEGFWKDYGEVLDQRFRQAGFAPHISGLRAARLHLNSLEKTASEQREVAEKLWDIDQKYGSYVNRFDATIQENAARYHEIVAEEYKKTLTNKMVELSKRLSRLNPTERKHAAMYASDLRAGSRVFVVAHSQGNLFANAALAEAARAVPDDASSLAMIGVGTPADRQFSDFYRTAHDDIVIDGMRVRAGWTVLPSNIDNDLTSANYVVASIASKFLRALSPALPDIYSGIIKVITSDTYIFDADRREPLNHGFISAYMAPGLPSARDIYSEMKRLHRDVPFPTSLANNSAIRAVFFSDRDIYVQERQGIDFGYRPQLTVSRSWAFHSPTRRTGGLPHQYSRNSTYLKRSEEIAMSCNQTKNYGGGTSSLLWDHDGSIRYEDIEVNLYYAFNSDVPAPSASLTLRLYFADGQVFEESYSGTRAHIQFKILVTERTDANQKRHLDYKVESMVNGSLPGT